MIGTDEVEFFGADNGSRLQGLFSTDGFCICGEAAVK
jgi:hypothetical protein